MRIRQRDYPQFAIGEIVEITEGRNKGVMCIVEEIVTEARHHHHGGNYSLYGWDQPNTANKTWRPDSFPPYPDSPSDYYFGDHVGEEHATTGSIASIEEIEQYRRDKHFDVPNDKGEQSGFGKDIDYILANLGKTVKVPRRGAAMV